MAIVEPMPNFLPFSTLRAEAAGVAMSPPRLYTAHIPNSCQELLPGGIRAMEASLVRPLITTGTLLFLAN